MDLDRFLSHPGVVMIIGAADTGKTTFARRLLAQVVEMGKSAAYVDSDLSQTTVGPPACVGLHWVRRPEDLDSLAAADELRFVGSTTPDGVVLPHVVSTAALVEVGRRQSDYVILDTTSVVSGVVGQTLKYHTMELCDPVRVVAFQHGSEMEPIVGMLRRFLSAKVELLAADPEIIPMSPSDRSAARAAAFAKELRQPLGQWRVAPTVFAPTLPAGFELDRLHGMLVGVQDAAGLCLGLGVLRYEGGVLRVATHHGDDMRGLRLGSLRIDLETYDTTPVRLRQLIFGV